MVWLCYTLTYTVRFYISMMKQPHMEDYMTFEDGGERFWSDFKKWSNIQTMNEFKNEIMHEFDISEKDWKASSETIKLGLSQLWKTWSQAEGTQEDVRNWIDDCPI